MHSSRCGESDLGSSILIGLLARKWKGYTLEYPKRPVWFHSGLGSVPLDRLISIRRDIARVARPGYDIWQTSRMRINMSCRSGSIKSRSRENLTIPTTNPPIYTKNKSCPCDLCPSEFCLAPVMVQHSSTPAISRVLPINAIPEGMQHAGHQDSRGDTALKVSYSEV